MKKYIALVQEALREWSEDKAARLAAALAYYTIFSLVPLLMVIIALAGLVGQGSVVQDQVLWQLENLVGEEGREFVQDMIVSAAERPQTGFVATLVGTVTLLFGALGVFGQLQESLNTIWEVRPKPVKGLWRTIKRQVIDRFLSFTVVLGIGFLLLVSLVVNAGLEAMQAYMSVHLPLPGVVMSLINFSVSLGVITLLFALMFKILPDAQMAWRDVWLGAAVTALLFTIGKMAIATYLGRSQINSSYGAAGSLVLILVWIYYSAQILFLGAEFTQVYANKFGSGIRPDADAEMVTEDERAHQGMARNGGTSGAPAPAPTAQPASLGVAGAALAEHATYQPAAAAYEIDSKDARLQGQVLPAGRHASRLPGAPPARLDVLPSEQPADMRPLLQGLGLPVGLAGISALLVGTLVHLTFIRPRTK